MGALKITGQSAEPTVTSSDAGTIYYDSTANVLKVYNGTSWVDTTGAGFVTAAGPDGAAGVEDGDYKYHVFNSTKIAAEGFVVTSVGNALGSNTVEYLVIAGGGSGGSSQGAGGGAGGYRNSTILTPAELSGGNTTAEAAITVSAQGYAITVGNGGTSPGESNQGSDGSPSTFSTITATGGGGGGKDATVGRAGGSGGGGGYNKAGGIRTASPVQGFDGGDGHGSPKWPTGGGGGASAEGGSPADGNAADGAGGNGLSSQISGSAVTRAGGGGGSAGTAPGDFSVGGSGGGGDGAKVGSGEDGGTNTGSGGGGRATGGVAGAGGQGVVIIRYKFKN